MLVPLDDAAHTPSAQPWTTYALLTLCALVFVPLWATNQANVRTGKRLLEQAIVYHGTHPYLQLDSRLEQLLSTRGAESAPTPAVEDPGKSLQSTARGSSFAALEQAELDGLTRAGFDTLARLPYWRWGVLPSNPSVKGLVGHLFLHTAWLPLLGNLAILFLVGSYLESRWSPGLVAGCFLACGVTAAGVFILGNPAFPVPLVGGSAGVAGLVGAFAVAFATEKVSARYWLGPQWEGTLEVPAVAVVAVWGVREALSLISPEVVSPARLGLAAMYWNHLAGLCLGVVYGVVVRFKAPATRVLGMQGATPEPSVHEILREVLGGREAKAKPSTGTASKGLSGAARAEPGKNADAPRVQTLESEASTAGPRLPSSLPEQHGVPLPSSAALKTPASVVRPSRLQVTHAVPVGIRQDRLGIELEGGLRRVLPLGRIKGVAAAEVYDGGLKPDYVLDLVLEFAASPVEPVSIVRFHSTRFDPRGLVPGAVEVRDALLSLVGRLLGGGGGEWLLGSSPDALRTYDSPADHQRELTAVLKRHAGAGRSGRSGLDLGEGNDQVPAGGGKTREERS